MSSTSSELAYLPKKRASKPGAVKRGRKPAKDDDYEE